MLEGEFEVAGPARRGKLWNSWGRSNGKEDCSQCGVVYENTSKNSYNQCLNWYNLSSLHYLYKPQCCSGWRSLPRFGLSWMLCGCVIISLLVSYQLKWNYKHNDIQSKRKSLGNFPFSWVAWTNDIRNKGSSFILSLWETVRSNITINPSMISRLWPGSTQERYIPLTSTPLVFRSHLLKYNPLYSEQYFCFGFVFSRKGFSV